MNIINRAIYARKYSGIPVHRQYMHILALRRGEGKLGASDYYDLRLYDKDSFNESAIEEYLGWRKSKEIDALLNHNYWRATANDKILCMQLLGLAGISIPETLVVYSKYNRAVAGCRTISDADEFLDYLRTVSEYPVFIKPNAGTYGRSSFALSGYDVKNSVWHTTSGESLTEATIRETIDFLPFKGFLVQKTLVQHPTVNQAVGNTVSCVRLMILLNYGKPEPFYAFWKIASGHNMTDNFSRGATGNLLANVDLDSGEITRVITGLGEKYHEIDSHPDTRERLLGLRLPGWNEALQQCLQGAKYFEGLGFQHWDLAFSANGPIVLEVNTEPDLSIPQLVARRGFLDGKMRRALDQVAAHRKQVKQAIRNRKGK